MPAIAHPSSSRKPSPPPSQAFSTPSRGIKRGGYEQRQGGSVVPDFTSFFVAGAGAAAALVGLLFVAVSISPERTVGPDAPPERQMTAEGAFTALTNAFFVCFGALIPNTSIGLITVIVGAIGLWHTLTTGARMLRASEPLTVARRLFYVATSVIVYSLECFYALQILGTFGR